MVKKILMYRNIKTETVCLPVRSAKSSENETVLAIVATIYVL